MDRVKTLGIGLMVCFLVLVGAVIYSKAAESEPNNDAPDIDLVAANSYEVSFNVVGEPDRKRVKAFVNNEYKRLVKTDRAEYSYRSEFPIKILRLEAKNRTGSTIKKYNIPQ